MKEKLFIDGDIIAYSVCSNAEQVVEWEEDDITVHCSKSLVAHELDTYIEKLTETASGYKNTDLEPVVCLTGSSNFRKTLAESYKANRKSSRKPVGLKWAKEYLVDRHSALLWDYLEADDLIGILATSYVDKCVISSSDKDLLQIPGYHLTSDGLMHHRIEECDRFHMVQTLTGDATDNYKGCPGVGPVKAEKILTPEDDTTPDNAWMWEQVVAAYEKAGLTVDDALLNARLAYILRDQNYNRDTEEMILWEPPHSKTTTNISCAA